MYGTNVIAKAAFSSAILFGFLLIFAILIWFCYNKKKGQNRYPAIVETNSRSLEINWENNYDYERRNNITEENDPESFLPEWLKERKEMIISRDCVEKGKELGSGQFGEVFKGKFIQGSAVYVL